MPRLRDSKGRFVKGGGGNNFGAQVASFERRVLARGRAIIKTAVQDTINIAQTTVFEGGRMRIKTGFLRASIQGALGTLPRGPVRGVKGETYGTGVQVSGEDLSLVLLRWDPFGKEKLFVGWTANYARPREYRDGFLRGAVEQWDRTVAKAARQVKI